MVNESEEYNNGDDGGPHGNCFQSVVYHIERIPSTRSCLVMRSVMLHQAQLSCPTSVPFPFSFSLSSFYHLLCVWDLHCVLPSPMPETTKTDDTSDIQSNNNGNSSTSLGVPTLGSRPSSVSLSPAVSAFQFKPNHLRHNRSMERLDNSTVTSRPIGGSSSGPGNASSNHHLSTSLDMKRSQSNRTMHNSTRAKSPVSPRPSVTTGSCIIKDGYVYKDEIVILDEKKKEELLKVGEIRLQSEWTFWYDR